MGAQASDAFTVDIGVGSSMTSLDVINGDMVVDVTAHAGRRTALDPLVHPGDADLLRP